MDCGYSLEPPQNFSAEKSEIIKIRVLKQIIHFKHGRMSCWRECACVFVWGMWIRKSVSWYFFKKKKTPIECTAYVYCKALIEPRREKTGLWGFRPGLTQTDLYSHRSRLEA